MQLGAADVAALVQQAPEVQVRPAVLRVDRERAAIRLLRLLRRVVVEVAAPAVPRVAVERRPAAPPRRGAHDRRDLARELADVEVEQRLPRLGVPAGASVLDDDVLAVRRDPHRRERPALGELRTERAERAADPRARDAGVDEPRRGAQEHEVLEGEPELVAGPRRGATNPARASRRTSATGRSSILETSRDR